MMFESGADMVSVVRPGDEITHSDLFNECLETIERQQATIADCVAQYPELDDLEGLLTSAVEAHELSYAEMPSKADLRNKVLAQFAAQIAPVQPKPKVLHFPRLPHYATAYLRVAAIICAVLFVGVGAGFSSGEAVPGDSLYFLKRAVEQAQLSLANDQTRPAVWYHIAEMRIQEITILSSRQQTLSDTALKSVLADVTTALNMQTDAVKRTVLIQEVDAALNAAVQSGALSDAAEANALTSLNALVTPAGNGSNTVAFAPDLVSSDAGILNVPSASDDSTPTDSGASYTLPLVPVSPPLLNVPTAPNITDNSGSDFSLPLVPVGSH